MSVDKVAVIGSGIMGSGIAQVAAVSGQEVTIIDTSEEMLVRASERMESSLNILFQKGRVKESPAGVLKRVHRTTNLAEGVADADFVIEAVYEDLNLKSRLLKEAAEHAPEHAILASNTSGLSITLLAGATNRPDRVIGMHWMNPPQIMKLVELVRGKQTSQATLETAVKLCQRYQKEPVISQKDVWFFLSVRAQTGWFIEACLMYLAKEADFREIDAMARYKVGLPMGPFELMDFSSAMEIRPNSMKSIGDVLRVQPDFEPWPAYMASLKYVVDNLWGPMNQQGMIGIKSGQGFYTYPGGKYAKPLLPQELAMKVEPVHVLAPAINNAAWCVTNGVGTITDVNKAFTLAYGWPKGIFQFVDECGVKNIIDVLRSKQSRRPAAVKEFYNVDPPLLDWKAA